MAARDHDSFRRRPDAPSLLMVSTVAPTIVGFLLPYAAHFRRRGWRVEAAARGVAGNPFLDGAFDELHELPLSRSIRDVPSMVRSMRALSRVLEADFDIVHVHTPIGAFVARATIRRMPVARRPAVVYTAHGFPFYPGGNRARNALFILAEKLAGRWTDRLVVINDADRVAALKHRIVHRSRLVLMPGIGIDTAFYSRSNVPAHEMARARASLGIAPGAPLFSVVGELTLRKRPFDVVEALARMRHEECHLVLVGDGPERARVEEAISLAGVRGRVHMAGVLADPRAMIAASTGLVLASRMEGLPRSVMEALSLEVPVVVSDARGSPDLVAPDAGLVFPVGDILALATAMDQLLDDPDEARAMAERGRAKMVENHGLPAMIARHEILYAGLLEGGVR